MPSAVALAAFPQFFDENGAPLPGGELWTYAAGTSTPLATHTDRSAAVENSNPVQFSSAGRAALWLKTNIAYKLVLKTAAGVTLDTVDNFYAGADPEQLIAAGIVPSTGGIYTGTVEFQGAVPFTGTPSQKLETLDTLGVSSVQNANLWINSDMRIWQRGGSSFADGFIGFDRTCVLAQSGSLTLSQLTTPTDGIPYAMRMTQPDASPKRMGFLQVIEAADCLAYRGSELVFCPKVRCSATMTIYAALVAWTSTADAPTRDVVNTWTSTTYTAGNFFVASTLPIAVGATSCTANEWTDLWVSSASAGGVVVPSTLNNLYMVVWTDQPAAQNVTLDASVIRCGRGTEPPLWTPPDPVAQMLRCQRYFYSIPGTSIIGLGQALSTTVVALVVPFPVTMFKSPVLTSNLLTALTAAGAPIVVNTAAIGTNGVQGASVNLTMASASFVAGNASVALGSAAASFLNFTAEL